MIIKLSRQLICVNCLFIIMLLIVPNQTQGYEYISEASINITDAPNEVVSPENDTSTFSIDGIVHCQIYGVRSVIVSL